LRTKIAPFLSIDGCGDLGIGKARGDDAVLIGEQWVLFFWERTIHAGLLYYYIG
jgi:hypothetical protein